MKYDLIVENDQESIVLNKSNSDEYDAICRQILDFCNMLCKSVVEFEEGYFDKAAFEVINDLIKENKRIMYSQISSCIYEYCNEREVEKYNDKVTNMQENLRKVIDYAYSNQFEKMIDSTSDSKEREQLEKSRLVLYKIKDHINLADCQYDQLKQTDEEFKKHFDERFNSKFEESYEKSSRDKLNEFSKEMNAQLLTLVGIFTALAFMIFGSLTGLSKMFSYDKVPVARLMIVGCIWGIAVLNLVFVFLFCVGKMTKTKFVSTDDKNATIWQKYPIVWWSDFIICTLLVWSSWIYYLQNREGLEVLDKCLTSSPKLTVVGGSLFFLIVMCCIFRRLKNATGFKSKD